MTEDERLAAVRPHKRQVDFQSLEFYGFIHFTVNTFTDREWGDGTESPDVFDPKSLCAEQWVTALKSAGMRGVILTCKHHDGFCLWHSRYTRHSVEYSPFRRDVVKEVSEACRKHGMKFGIYLSPWDRNCPLYGRGKEYDDYFTAQLTELLTGYGEIFTVWFDGACGEGADGKKQYYDWERYYAVIRELQPNACINVCGPDIRWCGNEAGHTRPSEWSVVPARTRDTEKISESSQHEDSEEFRLRKISAWDIDLGSRSVLADEAELVWYPAEVNTSIRPGWFWHESENDKVKSLDELVNIYYNSVGGNATFLLNVPPTSEGLIHKNDVKRLKELGEYLERAFSQPITHTAELSSDTAAAGCSAENMLSDSYDGYYTPEKGRNTAVITAHLQTAENIGHIVIKENICLGQRVESFIVEAGNGGDLTEIYRGTVIGYKRIIPLRSVRADTIRITVTDSRTEPVISFLGIYRSVD